MSQSWVDRIAAQAPAWRRCLSAVPVLLLLAAPVCDPVRAQTGRPAPAPATAAAVPPAASVSAADAQTALAVLRDDRRRAELITTLDVIAKAGPALAAAPPEPAAAAAAHPATTPAPPAPAPALNPDSVGAQLFTRVTLLLSAYAEQFAASFQSVNDLPILTAWLRAEATDPAARAVTLDAAAKMAIMFAVALAAEWLARRLLRALQHRLHMTAPRRSDHEVDSGAPPPAEAHKRRFERAMAAFRQLPALVGRLLLDLMPVAAFGAAAFVLLGSELGRPSQTRLIILDALQAYGLARVLIALAAFLYSPVTPRLRLLAVSDEAAAFLTRWTKRLVAIGVTGWALVAIGTVLGMPNYAALSLQKLVGLVVHVCLVIAVLQARPGVTRRLRPRRTATGVRARVQTRFAAVWHAVAIFFIVALWLVWAVEIRNGYQRLLLFCVETALIGIAGRQLGILALGGLERLRHALEPAGARVEGRVGVYCPVLRAMISTIIFVATGIALLEAWGLPVLFWLTAGGLGGRVLDAVRTIIVAVLLAIFAWEGVNALLASHLLTLTNSAQVARAGRLRTLLPLLRTSLLVALLLTVGMTVLSAIGVNIAPLLAGAGVIGIAVGFGSQKLVQDLITGLFLLLENAMQVGDVVTVGGLTGSVEALSIRTIRLRALDGAVHLIPFSSVTTVTNMTRDYSYAVVDVSIGLNEEPEPITEVLRTVGTELRQDTQWQTLVLDELDVMGIEKLTDMAWIMRVRMKTQPSSRWTVARELNRRIKVRFDELAIESPFTSHKVLSREAPLPASLMANAEAQGT